jgi:hypothetical protein
MGEDVELERSRHRDNYNDYRGGRGPRASTQSIL